MMKKVFNQPVDNVIDISDRQDSKPEKVLPFMDTFYALSSDDVYERNLAALSLLRHVFSQKINESGDSSRKMSLIKDGHYAFTRLLRGLCSSRASARQGYASCLSTFLELSFKLGPVSATNSGNIKCWMEYYMENEVNSSKNLSAEVSSSPLHFVRDQLMKHTVESSAGDNTGRAKGGEERDRMYGKIFGILAVVRSGTLFLRASSEKLIKRYVLDLLSLYEYKNWMREPSMHALQELVSSIYEKLGLQTLTALVNDALLSFFDHKHHAWTAEKIAVYLHLQTIYMNDKTNCDVVLPKTLKSPFLTSAALADGASPIVTTLRDTSKVVYPRCHLIWNTIWSYLTQPTVSSREKKNHPKKIHQHASSMNRSILSSEGCRLRDNLIVGNESSEDIIKSLVNGVISFSLLGTHDTCNTNETIDSVTDLGKNKITHERRALALTLIHQLCRLHLPAPVMEQIVLQPSVVTKLFINTLQMHGHSNKKTLQPLATYFLNEIIENVTTHSHDVGADYFVERRLAVIKALIKANPAFDSLSRTNSVAMLLGFGNKPDNDAISVEESELWESYLSFLKGQILRGNCSPSMTKNFIDMMYSLAHHVLRVGSVQSSEKIYRSILSFLMVGGFFDFKKLSQRENKKTLNEASSSPEILTAAYTIQARSLEGLASLTFPYTVRVAMSSRFFSLILEAISSPGLKIRGQELRDAKMKNALKIFDFLRLGWITLEANGAVPYERTQDNDNDLNSNLIESKEKVDSIFNLARKVESANEFVQKTRAVSEIACLASALLIQLLNPGSPKNEEVNNWEDLDEEGNDDIAEEVHGLILELSQIAEALDGNGNHSIASNEEEESNKLSSLSAVCVDILRSPCGGSSFKHNPSSGPAGKLIRTLIKSTWTACLPLSSIDLDTFRVDKGVMSIILSSVCGSTDMSCEYGSDVDDNSNSDSDSDSNTAEKDDDQVFRYRDCTAAKDLNDVCDISDKEEMNSEDGSDKSEEEDVQLDPSSLQNLLLEESDEEEKDLEHHAGADSALAQLIKMKQDARKAGKEQQEKVRVVHKLRCMVLLEAIFSCGKIQPQQIVMTSIRPLLHERKVLENSLSSTPPSIAGYKKNASDESEKRALINRITTLLQEKITKLDISKSTKEEDHNFLIAELMHELKRCDTSSHRSCCNALLVMIVKAISQSCDKSNKIDNSPFTGAVREWSIKKTTKFHSSTFFDLAAAAPSFSRLVLLEPLITSAKDARSAFIKAESFRIISFLYNKPKMDDTNKASTALNKYIYSIVTAFVPALSNNDFIKAKRARDILSAAEKIIIYVQNCKRNELFSHIALMKEPLKRFSEKLESAGVRNTCAKLEKDILKGLALSKRSVPEKSVEAVRKRKTTNKRKK